MARRYRTLPSSLLELDLDAFGINTACWRAGMEEEIRLAKKHRSRIADDE